MSNKRTYCMMRANCNNPILLSAWKFGYYDESLGWRELKNINKKDKMKNLAIESDISLVANFHFIDNNPVLICGQ